ncbi:MAG TPA: hypothetical protein VGP62_15975 [Bryobacteraceae bacterium]|jgi:hypothetical protein|nr:hypothetical protein [Bryobacteraceae bacterium]
MSPNNERLAESISQLEKSISGVCDNLRREMRQGFARLIERLDRINVQLDRQKATMETAFRSLRKF